MLYDISRTISPDLAVWTGDTPFSAIQQMHIGQGDSVNLFTLTMSAHTGSHADAPYHYLADGAHPAALGLEPYLGVAQVIHLTRREGGILPDEIAPKFRADAPRLLLRTWCSDLPDHSFPTDFPYPTPHLVDWLAERGVLLLGVDMPSVDAYTSQTLDAHKRLAAHGIRNLETLYLREVPEGLYELIALPLKIAGVCGAPLRAVLRTLIAEG
jgi:arylformamidase